MASLDDRSSPKDLKLMLCPVFSTSADQQEQFYLRSQEEMASNP